MKWKMVCLRVDEELFYVRLAISQRHRCFALSVWSSPTGAAKYRANLGMADGEKGMVMNGLRITSVENVPSIDKCMDQNGKYFWCIPETFTVKMLISDSRVIEWLNVDFDFEEKW